MYVTQTQLEDRHSVQALIDLTDRADPATGQIDVDVLDRAIDDAAAVIDGYLAGVYALPVAETPPLLTDIAGAIAIWKLHTYTPDDKVKDDFDLAMKQLDQIARGIIRLPLDGAEPARTDNGDVQTTNNGDRPFTKDNLEGFI